MKEIKLDDMLQEIIICKNSYVLDINDFDSINILTKFKEKHVTPAADDELLGDCKLVIDTVLGNGEYDKLFGNKKTMKAYLLVDELANIYLDLFMKDKRKIQEDKAKEEIEKLSKLLSGFDKFINTMKYAENKYGMRQNVSGKSSKKYKNRRN